MVKWETNHFGEEYFTSHPIHEMIVAVGALCMVDAAIRMYVTLRTIDIM